ncbi:TIGR02099 family protein [Marinobacter halodurans]|uniref:TIGR02099 family protein n=1 Tax=Marinobacter halodurans TaxID=2528979 RepID=A0ABY1ZQI3_9GAMM|nr:YhdP family protein [Marinobacter halodurans]TBW56818.1 TIGR02099 family protein [Marinobacter halodurans]
MDVSDPKHRRPEAHPETSWPMRWLIRLANLVWMAALALLILVALYVVIGRQLMYAVDRYQPQIEAALSQRLGQPVRIGQLHGQWKGLDPVLDLSGVEIRDPEHPEQAIARVERVDIRLDSVTSLVRRRLVFNDLVASGMDLTLEQSTSGAITVEGLALPQSEQAPEATGTGPRDWINRLGEVLSDPSVQLNQVHLGLKVPGEPRRTFFIPQVDLRYTSGVFSASGRAMQPRSTTQLARFYLEGRHFFRGDFDGRLFVDVDSGRLFDTFLQRYQWHDRAIDGIDAGGQAWLHFASGELERVNARVSVPHLQIRTDGQVQSPIESVEARVGWRRQAGDGWRLDVQGLGWNWEGQSVRDVDLRITREDGWDVVASRVPVGVLSGMAQSIAPLGEQLRNALEHYGPGGELHDLALRVPETADDFQLTATLAGVSVQAFDGAPEIQGLNGDLAMSRSTGRVSVDTADVTLGFPQLFMHPWSLDHVNAQVHWQIDGTSKRVWSDRIDIQYQGQTRLAGAFALKLEDPGDDTLSMRIDSWDAKASMLADFVPGKILGRDFYDWITTAVEEADIPHGVFYGHGEVNEGSPPGSFTTSQQYQFANARIQYDPRWPVVTGASGRVTVQGAKARIRLEEGSTGGLALEPTTVTVDGDADPVSLQVQTAAPFQGEQVADWLEQSPLGEFAGSAARDLAISGKYHLDLDLGLGLGGDASPHVKADLEAENGRIAYSDYSPAVWDELNGTVHYDSQSGFSGKPLTARFLDSPVELSLSRDGADAPLKLTQTGRMNLDDLASRFGIGNLPGIEGRAGYRAEMGLSPSGASSLTLTSSLSNVTVDWPEPLHKSMGQPVPLSMIVSWGDDGGLMLSGHWDDRLAFRLRWLNQVFERGRVELGARTTSVSGASGLEITGHLAQLDADTWNDALDSHSLTSGGTGAGSGIQWLSRVALSVDNLHAAGQSFHKAQVTATPDAKGWTAQLAGPDLAGRVRVPSGNKPLTVDLDHIVLTSGEEAGGEADKAPASFAERGVGQWSDADITIDSVQVDGRDYGQWSFLLRPAAHALNVDKIKGQVGSLTFDGNLIWSAGDSGERTRINGVLAGKNLADVSPWIEGSVPLRSKKTRVEIDLGWDGPPEAVSMERVEGTLEFRLDDGVILERSNTAQIFRVFGILNSDTLLRRLKLDFSDLYEAGVAYDAISGTARLASGTLTWDPELQIVGPSGAFKLTGSTDLIKETLDMRLVVVLPLTQNLPLAAILMGASAPIGGALFVLDKVLGDPLSRLTSATYSVTGSWDNPNVELRNVFDTGR